jgi:hypothetical protein
MTLVKRLTLFGLLGPFLGFMTAFWGLLQILTVAVGDPPTIDPGQLVLLPMAYVLGIAPALIAGAIDHSVRNARFGPLYTCLAGYLLGFMPIGAALVMGFIRGPYVLLFGLIGAIPALICSALARRVGRAGNDDRVP